MALKRQHHMTLNSTSQIEYHNKETKRSADVVVIFPQHASIMRLIGEVLFEQNDGRQTQNRYMQVESFEQIGKEEVGPILTLTAKAA